MALHIVTIPKGFDFTSQRILDAFIKMHSYSEMMGYEMCAWLDDVYFNGASRTKAFNDGDDIDRFESNLEENEQHEYEDWHRNTVSDPVCKCTASSPLCECFVVNDSLLCEYNAYTDPASPFAPDHVVNDSMF